MHRAALLLCFLASSALAGDWHTDSFPASVVTVERVRGYQLSDPFVSTSDGGSGRPAGPGDLTRPVLGEVIFRPDEEVCRVELRVGGAFARLTRAPQVVVALPALCSRIRTGTKVELQYFGLAQDFRLVSLRLNEKWYALRLMRQTANPDVRSCFDGATPRWLEGRDDCRQLVHPDAL